MSGYGNYMEESNIEWYIEKAKELTEYINEMNKVADQVMKDNPDMVVILSRVGSLPSLDSNIEITFATSGTFNDIISS